MRDIDFYVRKLSCSTVYSRQIEVDISKNTRSDGKERDSF